MASSSKMFVFPVNNEGYRSRKRAYKSCIQCKRRRKKCRPADSKSKCEACLQDNIDECSLISEPDPDSNEFKNSPEKYATEHLIDIENSGTIRKQTSHNFDHSEDPCNKIPSLVENYGLASLDNLEDQNNQNKVVGSNQTSEFQSKRFSHSSESLEKGILEKKQIDEDYIPKENSINSDEIDDSLFTIHSLNNHDCLKNISNINSSEKIAIDPDDFTKTTQLVDFSRNENKEIIVSKKNNIKSTKENTTQDKSQGDKKIISSLKFIYKSDPLSELLTVEKKPYEDMLGIWVQNKFIKRKVPPSLLYYLKSIDAFYFISDSERDDLLNIYFGSIDVFLPIVDKDSFFAGVKNKTCPLILLGAVLLIAAKHPLAERLLGGTSSREFCHSVSTKVRALLNVHAENDKLTFCRVFALLSMHAEGFDGAERACADLRLAINHAFVLGLHHKRTYMGQVVLKKLWWSLWCLDRLSAMVNAQPMMINLDDVCIKKISPYEEGWLGKLVGMCEILETVLDMHRPNKKNGQDILISVDIPDFLKGCDCSFEKYPVNCNSLKSYYPINSYSAALIILHYTIVITSYKKVGFIDKNLLIVLKVAVTSLLDIVESFYNTLPPFPYITYGISLTLSVFLKCFDHKLDFGRHSWKTSCILLERSSKRFWIAALMAHLGNKVFKLLKDKNNDPEYNTFISSTFDSENAPRNYNGTEIDLTEQLRSSHLCDSPKSKEIFSSSELHDIKQSFDFSYEPTNLCSEFPSKPNTKMNLPSLGSIPNPQISFGESGRYPLVTGDSHIEAGIGSGLYVPSACSFLTKINKDGVNIEAKDSLQGSEYISLNRIGNTDLQNIQTKTIPRCRTKPVIFNKSLERSQNDFPEKNNIQKNWFNLKGEIKAGSTKLCESTAKAEMVHLESGRNLLAKIAGKSKNMVIEISSKNGSLIYNSKKIPSRSAGYKNEISLRSKTTSCNNTSGSNSGKVSSSLTRETSNLLSGSSKDESKGNARRKFVFEK